LTAQNRRFPLPWSIDEENTACFIVRDHDGKSLAYVYFEGGTRPAIGGQDTHAGRVAAHRRQHRQTAGAAPQAALSGAPAALAHKVRQKIFTTLKQTS
jgi:hypothetical protein